MEIETIRECPKCKKSFVESKGFYKTAGYCKGCQKKYVADSKTKDEYSHHKWSESVNLVSKCVRCGLRRKTTPTWKVGFYKIEYLVNGEWIKKSQLCNITKTPTP